MEQYIKKSAIVAEIERIEYETNYEPFTDEVLGKRKVCKDIKDSIDTFEVKEVDLEKEIHLWMEANTCGGYCSANIRETAEHFFELGLKAGKGE
jgi:hypothetical protein